MGVKVCKFGGSSLADGRQFEKVRQIIQSDDQRRYVVVSAPGKRDKKDHKITDLLYLCHAHAKENMAFGDVFSPIADRYREIVRDLKLSLDIDPLLEEVRKGIDETKSADYAASRGEYLNAIIMADYLGCTFVDTFDVIFFDKTGRLDNKRTQQALAATLKKHERAVLPGFFGQDANGQVKTFSRGGSDITGALVARGIGADVYENWTDVSGLLMTDPRIVDDPRPISLVTYKELRELAYMGATVLHDEAIFPVRAAGIPVNVRNTNDPEAPGTMIVDDEDESIEKGAFQITGIAGRKDFTVLALEKALMNGELGFGRRLLGVLETNGVSFEHAPTGIDTMSLVVADTELAGKLDRVLEEIQRVCQPDALDVHPNMALIATVGRGMAHTPGSAAKLFGALGEAGINIRMIDQGSSELNIIVGVEEDDFEKAIRAIYERFVRD